MDKKPDIRVFDLSGKQIKFEQEILIDKIKISGITEGLYLLKLETESSPIIFKVPVY